MSTDKSIELICTLAAWNGRFSATLEIALISFKHNNPTAGIQALEKVHAEYEAYRNAEYQKLTGEQPNEQAAPQT
jgi:hypothetical protein